MVRSYRCLLNPEEQNQRELHTPPWRPQKHSRVKTRHKQLPKTDVRGAPGTGRQHPGLKVNKKQSKTVFCSLLCVHLSSVPRAGPVAKKVLFHTSNNSQQKLGETLPLVKNASSPLPPTLPPTCPPACIIAFCGLVPPAAARPRFPGPLGDLFAALAPGG